MQGLSFFPYVAVAVTHAQTPPHQQQPAWLALALAQPRYSAGS